MNKFVNKLVRMGTYYLPVRQSLLDDSSKYLKLCFRSQGIDQKLTEDCLNSLCQEAYRRALSLRVNRKLCFGVFFKCLDEVAEDVEQYFKKQHGDLSKVGRILAFYEGNRKGKFNGDGPGH